MQWMELQQTISETFSFHEETTTCAADCALKQQKMHQRLGSDPLYYQRHAYFKPFNPSHPSNTHGLED